MLTISHRLQSHLDKVLMSVEFARAGRMAQFLRFVVEATLAERIDDLKERQIGISVFGRPASWDPKVDNIVRGEARRLRAKLDAYYSTAGKDDPIRISMPKGGYAIVFTDAAPPETSGPHPYFRVQANSPARGPRKIRTFAAAVSLLLVVFAIVLVFARRRVAVSARQDSFEVLPFATEIGQEFSPAVSPDGRRIAYVWDGNKDNYDIYLKDVATGALSRLTQDPSPDLNPAWSPDGAAIALLRIVPGGAEIVLKAVSTGQERILTETANPISTWIADSNPFFGCYGPAWSPDGRRVVTPDREAGGHGFGIYQVDVQTGEKKELTAPPGEGRDTCPHFSPDGANIAFVRYVSHGISEVHSMLSDGSNQRQLTSDRRTIRGLDWSSDGSRIIFSSLHQGSFQLREIGREGGESRLLPASTSSAVDPSESPGEKLLAFTDLEENWNIWRVRLTGDGMSAPEMLLSSTGKNHSPSYSPDGRQIAFVSDRSGSPEIWIAGQNGGDLRQLTHFNGPWLGSIRWSPDGTTLAFDARPGGHSGIFTIPVAGGKPTPLEEDRFEERRPTWSADGRAIYFNSNRGGSLQIWEHVLATGEVKPIGPPDTNTSTESPDGQDLYFGTNSYEVWRCDPDGRNASRLPQGPRPEPGLNWSLARAGIYFAGHEGVRPAIFFYRFSDHATIRIGSLDRPFAPGTPSLYVSPDGKWLLFAQLDHVSSDIKIRRPGV